MEIPASEASFSSGRKIRVGPTLLWTILSEAPGDFLVFVATTLAALAPARFLATALPRSRRPAALDVDDDGGGHGILFDSLQQTTENKENMVVV